jgi:hypothetical protein
VQLRDRSAPFGRGDRRHPGRVRARTRQRVRYERIARDDHVVADLEMTGNADADLYVKVGGAPSLSSYDCRPYKTGSTEACRVTIAQPTTIGVMVNGYSASSTFKLVGKKI